MNAVEKLKAELESAIAAVIKQYAETVQRSYEVEAKQIWDRLVGENIRYYDRLRDGHHRELDRQARWVSHLFFEKVPGKYGEMPQELLIKEFPAKAVSAIAAKEAAEQAADAQVSYIKKNMQKLSPLVTTRMLKSIHLKSTGIKDYAPFTMLDFVFEDGSHFTVMNQLVWVSNVANPFTRFPTTFHNAEIDGVKVASPSEAKLKLLMNKTTAALAIGKSIVVAADVDEEFEASYNGHHEDLEKQLWDLLTQNLAKDEYGHTELDHKSSDSSIKNGLRLMAKWIYRNACDSRGYCDGKMSLQGTLKSDANRDLRGNPLLPWLVKILKR
jgi:hypothetical protein